MYICSQLLFLFLCKLYFTQHNTPHIDPRSQKMPGLPHFDGCIFFHCVFGIGPIILSHSDEHLSFGYFCLCELFQWTWEYRCPFHILVSAPLSIFPKVSFLHHIVVLFLVGIFFLERFTYHLHSDSPNLLSHQWSFFYLHRLLLPLIFWQKTVLKHFKILSYI